MEWVAYLAFSGFIAGLIAWGTFVLSGQDSRAKSWLKIAIAAALLVAFGALRLFPPVIHDDSTLAYAMIFLFYQPMVAVGAAICVGVVAGGLLALVRIRNRPAS